MRVPISKDDEGKGGILTWLGEQVVRPTGAGVEDPRLEVGMTFRWRLLKNQTTWLPNNSDFATVVLYSIHVQLMAQLHLGSL